MFSPFAFIQDPEVLAAAIQQYILAGGDFTTFNVPNYGGIVRTNITGGLDTTFNMSIGFPNLVNDAKYQSNGKLIAVGNFTTYGPNTGITRIIRINTDGTLDATFNTTGFNAAVNTVVIQPDGKIICGGTFTTYRGVTVNRIVRIDSTGTRDATFNVGVGFDGTVNTLAIEPSSKVLVGGAFTTYSGSTINRIARLNSNGTADTINFGGGLQSFNDTVNDIQLQSDGKVVVGGNFTTYATFNNCLRIARLTNSGSFDTTFSGSFFDNNVNNLKIQPDGKIVVVGQFTNKIARIYLVGNQITADPDFKIGNGFDNFNNLPAAGTIQIDSNKNIYITNNFTSYSGSNASRIVRLLPSGAIDTSYNVGPGLRGSLLNVASTATYGSGTALSGSVVQIYGQFATYAQPPSNRLSLVSTTGNSASFFDIGEGFSAGVYSYATESNGKIIVVGTFGEFAQTRNAAIVRLTPTGSRDTTFISSSGFDGLANAVAIQSDGKIVVGGSWVSTYSGSAAPRIIRLNTSGSIDTTFNPGTGFPLNNNVNTLAIQSDGKIVAGGTFTSYSGSAANRIIRLNTDGTIDNTFLSSSRFNNNVNDIAIQSNGKLLVIGNFTTYSGSTINRIIRLNTDGTRDTSFNPGTGGLGTAGSVLALQSDEKIVAGGAFTSYSGSTVYRIVRINTDGTRDTTFNAVGSNNIGFGGTVTGLGILADGRIAVGGEFLTFNLETPPTRIAILYPTGGYDSSFNQPSSPFNSSPGGYNNNLRKILILNA
jgi:uncharacterized delta-60 repeat protein